MLFVYGLAFDSKPTHQLGSKSGLQQQGVHTAYICSKERIEAAEVDSWINCSKSHRQKLKQWSEKPH